jgi:methylated-DNA-[protein]-cysteine S-methyltransferase
MILSSPADAMKTIMPLPGSREEQIMSKSGGKNPKAYVYKFMKSPVGELKLVASDKGLAAILWEDDNPKRVRLNMVDEDPHNPILAETERQLSEYFAGTRKTFSVKLDFNGTDFQKRVWQALLRIPFGQTRSYGEIAKSLGNAKAMRAVGAANGKNPISIIAPCHRVIGSTGQLTGFAGGLEVKARLLDLERGDVSQLSKPVAGRRKSKSRAKEIGAA